MTSYHQKIRHEFNKAYTPVLIASLILGILTISLVFVILFMEEDESDLLKAPKYKDLYISQVDGSDKNKMQSLRNILFDKMPVKFSLLNDYYKKNIYIFGVNTKLIDNSLIVSSDNGGNKNYTEFISQINLNGSVEWITVISDSKYKNIVIYDVFKYQDGYYTVGTGIKGGVKHLLGIKLASDGSIKQIESLDSKFDGNIYFAAQTKDNIAIVLTEDRNIKVIYMNYDLKLEESVYDFADFNKYPKASLRFYGHGVDGNNLVICMNVKDYLGTYNLKTNDYILNIDLKDNVSNLVPVNNVTEKLDNMMERIAYVFENSILYLTANDKLERYLINGKYANTIDYSNLELEESDKYISSQKEENNSLKIIKAYDNLIVSETMYYRIYDVVNKEYNIYKRYVRDLYRNPYDAGLYETMYINNKFFDIHKYSYGSMTSLLIGIVG